MEAVHSFAPLAGRLAAKVAEIRPVKGAAISWANFMALFFCAIFEMLILLCEALDARAAADARAVAAPALHEGAARLSRARMPITGRAPRLALAPDVQVISLNRDAAPSEMAEPAPVGPWLAWARHPGPAWAVAGRIAIRPKRVGLQPGVKHDYVVTISI